MGKFLKYEDSNWRSFIIDTTANTIKRPKRPVTKEDLLGAIFVFNGKEAICLTVSCLTVSDVTEAIAAWFIGDGGIESVTYVTATDTFVYDESTLTNVFIDEFGREEMYI